MTMKKGIIKRVLGVTLAATMVTLLMAGCGDDSSSKKVDGGTQSASSSKYEEPLTIDVFDSQANFQGIQTGWFAKIVKDKFNMELNIIAPNVAGGGDTLYQTRSANGNLGDLIITNADKSRLKDMVSAGLVLDMTDYMADCTYLQKYSEAIESTSALAEQEGTWAVPSEISTLSPTEPCEASDPTNAASIRWDLYGQVGYPEIGTLEDLLPVLKEMQDAAGTSDSGKDVYAFSLFKDWDGDVMQNAGALAALYGYQPSGFCMEKVDGSDMQSVIDEDGIYVRSLKFLYEANQMGLVDPESTTQDFTTTQNKFRDGAVLYSLWPWLGSGVYNTTEHTAEGKGFACATIDDMACLSHGSMPYGKLEATIMVGSQAKDPQRLVDFIDWLYSPEGIMASCPETGGTCGPEGLTWEMKDGEPVLTDFGVQAFVDIKADLSVPDEWGGGTWKDGISALNFKTVGIIDENDENGMCYNYQRWDDYLEKTATPLSEDWSAHNNNASTAIDYMNDTNHIMVLPGTNYAAPEYSTDISTTKEQCKQTIVEYSWKMVFANSDDEFNSLLAQMQDTVEGLGYNDVLAVDEQNCKDHFAAMDEAVKAAQ